MSYYSDSNVKTDYIEATSFIENSRVIYELRGHRLAYLPHLRLVDVAVTRSARDTTLNRLGGIFSIIKNARLVDGSTELSAMREANRFLAFKNQNIDNSKALGIKNAVEGTVLGFEYGGELRTLQHNGYTPRAGVKATKGTSDSYTIDLREVFPILKNISHLPSTLFKNLRIEIEFESNVLNLLVDANQTATNQRPLLAVDYLENPMIVKKLEPTLKTINWLEIEEDSFFVTRADATAGATQLAVQTANEKSNGFQNKHVERLLVAKEVVDVQDAGGFLNTNIVTPSYGPLGSYAAFRETFQVRLNGRNLLPREGLTKPNELLSYLVDTWGEQALYPGAHLIDPSAVMSTIIAQANDIPVADNYRGSHSYFGLYIGDTVDDLQINYSRAGLQDTTAEPRPATENTRIHLFAEVKKALQVSNGGYSIVYM